MATPALVSVGEYLNTSFARTKSCWKGNSSNETWGNTITAISRARLWVGCSSTGANGISAFCPSKEFGFPQPAFEFPTFASFRVSRQRNRY